MTGLLRYFLLLLVLSGLIHIIAILTTPFFAQKKVWQHITSSMPEKEITAFFNYKDIKDLLGQADPAMVYGVCWFSLNQGPVTLVAEGPTRFWNVTIYNDDAEAIYSLHNEVSESNLLNLEIRKAGSKQEEPEPSLISSLPLINGIPTPSSRPLSKAEEETLLEDDQKIRTRVKGDNAFAVLKIFRSSPPYQKLIQEAFEEAECR